MTGFFRSVMNHEEKDDLWELLGRAKPTRVSPFFSRNVLRVIREAKSERVGFFGRFHLRWIAAAVGLVAVVLGGYFLTPRPQPEGGLVEMVEHLTASPDYAVISNLDELLAAEESSVWLDHSLH